MRKTAQVKKMLTDICITADKKIYSINYGGCAVFSVMLAEQLENCGYNDYKIRVYTQAYDGVNISNAEHKVHGNHNMISWNRNRVDFAHVVVEWRGMMWNAGCVTPRKNVKRVRFFFSVATW